MKYVFAIALSLFSALALAQQTTLGAAALAGSFSGSGGFAIVGLQGLGTADANVLAKNDGTALSNLTTGIQLLNPISPLASTGNANSTNTTTVTPQVNLPVSGIGLAGGQGIGQNLAHSGAWGAFTNVGSLPALPSLLPNLPQINPLPALPALPALFTAP